MTILGSRPAASWPAALRDHTAGLQPGLPGSNRSRRRRRGRRDSGRWPVFRSWSLAAASAPAPLYGLHQAQFRFSAATLTAIFAVYALVVLITLLVFGSLSDYLGR